MGAASEAHSQARPGRCQNLPECSWSALSGWLAVRLAISRLRHTGCGQD